MRVTDTPTNVPNYITTTVITVQPVTEYRKIADGGPQYGPPEQHRIQIEIDVDYLLRELGSKAVRNSNGTSLLLGGRITVRHLN